MSSPTRPEPKPRVERGGNRRICVDSSVALKLVLDEEDSDKAHALWASWVAEDFEIIAPCHLAFEVTSVIRNHVYRGEISAEAGQVAFEAIHAQGIKLVPPRYVARESLGASPAVQPAHSL